jgi:hypothetical protein
LPGVNILKHTAEVGERGAKGREGGRGQKLKRLSRLAQMEQRLGAVQPGQVPVGRALVYNGTGNEKRAMEAGSNEHQQPAACAIETA